MAGGRRPAWREGRYGGQQSDESFGEGRADDDERSDRRVGQVGRHRQLDYRKNVADAYTKGREAEDPMGRRVSTDTALSG
jgi:hypothetical protein